jgi:hypothetical protein
VLYSKLPQYFRALFARYRLPAGTKAWLFGLAARSDADYFNAGNYLRAAGSARLQCDDQRRTRLQCPRARKVCAGATDAGANDFDASDSRCGGFA